MLHVTSCKTTNQARRSLIRYIQRLMTEINDAERTCCSAGYAIQNAFGHSGNYFDVLTKVEDEINLIMQLPNNNATLAFCSAIEYKLTKYDMPLPGSINHIDLTPGESVYKRAKARVSLQDRLHEQRECICYC